jgi:hypothetical protein
MVPPTALTLLAADRVARNRSDGRCDLSGVFHALNLKLPATLTFAVYFVLSGCHGPTDLEFIFLDPDDNRLSGGTIHLPAAHPLAIVQGTGMVEGAVIERPGTYRLRIECAGEVLAERPVLIGPW